MHLLQADATPGLGGLSRRAVSRTRNSKRNCRHTMAHFVLRRAGCVKTLPKTRTSARGLLDTHILCLLIQNPRSKTPEPQPPPPPPTPLSLMALCREASAAEPPPEPPPKPPRPRPTVLPVSLSRTNTGAANLLLFDVAMRSSPLEIFQAIMSPFIDFVTPKCPKLKRPRRRVMRLQASGLNELQLQTFGEWYSRVQIIASCSQFRGLVFDCVPRRIRLGV